MVDCDLFSGWVYHVNVLGYCTHCGFNMRGETMTNDIRAKSAHRLDLPRLGVQHIALAVVAFALVVMAPRLTLAFLIADGLSLDEATERKLLIATAVATALVVTLGNAFLSHVLALHFRKQMLHILLAVVWAAYIALTVAIIPPVLMVNLQTSPLARVLTSPDQQWQWAQAVTVLVEVLVAGSMMAYAIVKREATPASQPLVSVSETVAPALPPQDAPAPRQGVPLDDLDRAIMAAYAANPTASKAAVARQANTTRQTVDNRLSKLQAAGLAHVNGAVHVTGTH